LPEITLNPIFSSVLWFGLLFVLMYFMMIRPQQKEQRARAEMMRSFKPGDKIVTAGGLVGVITKVEDVSIKVRIAERVEVDVLKTGVARTLKD
jgi:preprotein translocase subunit YajC